MRFYRREQAELICNKMLKGIDGKLPPNITDSQIETFRNRFLILAELLTPHLPRKTSAIFGAVLCKCAIKYGLPKVIELAEAIKNGVFVGQDDPAKHLWEMLVKVDGQAKDKADTIYRKTVTGARAYCEGRTLNNLRPATTDIFTWDADFRYPVERSVLGEPTKPKSGSQTKTNHQSRQVIHLEAMQPNPDNRTLVAALTRLSASLRPTSSGKRP